MSKWEDEFPKWLHLLDDNTWINPISEMLIVENLSPDEPYLIGQLHRSFLRMFVRAGDDWGGFLGGGAGLLMSRAAVKRLLGPPVVSTVTYRWPNGTHSIQVDTQLQSCVARMQGGDWCFFHGDWALPACLKEVGVPVIDAGSPSHGGFFSQLNQTYRESDTWFNVGKEIAPTLHHTHSAALHVDPDEMYDIFYNKVAPYYRNLFDAFTFNAIS